jgi:hypothetical protein
MLLISGIFNLNLRQSTCCKWSISNRKEVSMGEEMEVGCARPTGGPVGEIVESGIETHLRKMQFKTREVSAMIQVGKKAPDFVSTRLSQRQIRIG